MSERLTPHVIGNQGEAPVPEKEWDAMPLWEKLTALAEKLDEGARRSPSGIEEWYDAETCQDVHTDLERTADDLFKWCRDHGMTP